MRRQKFKCTLLSDVIINTKSASEGANSTLEFIPGNCFLGIAAVRYDNFDRAYDVFHSGKVRFGDAHPAIGEKRTLFAASSLFSQKLDETQKRYYNFHHIKNVRSEEIINLQLKQSRKHFFDYVALPPVQAEQRIRFSIKTAYDRTLRRSMDEKMFGYEALTKGQVFYFEVESDYDDDLIEQVTKALEGEKRIGRSRSAQYGLVEIKPVEYEEVASGNNPFAPGLYTVYADGRLIFTDRYGLPTCTPTAQDLGFGDGAEIDFSRSQVRVFQYAPYNGKRKCFDADRFGIEKGSVFVVKADHTPDHSAYVGLYNNEGFGRVIYNPDFLLTEEYVLEKKDPGMKDDARRYIAPSGMDSSLVALLKQRNNSAFIEDLIYKEVNTWVAKYASAFAGERMASQWGQIRRIALGQRFAEPSVLKDIVRSYLSHGIAKDMWVKRNRLSLLMKFFEDCEKDERKDYLWLALVNLASEMAKISKK